jgi:hypothetical protein
MLRTLNLVGVSARVIRPDAGPLGFYRSRVDMNTMDQKPIIIDGSSEPYVRLEDLARMLNVKTETISDWSRRYPDFPHLLLPGSVRVRVSEVTAWLEKLKKNGPKSKKGKNE